MLKKLLNIIKIKYTRLVVKRQWKVGNRISFNCQYLTPDENKLVQLIKQKSKDESVEVLIAPLSEKRYIIDKSNHIYIIMDCCDFTVLSENSKLRYHLPVIVSDFIWEFVDRQIEKKRIKLEDEINNMIGISLDNLLIK
jgi:phosphoribosyl-ATP pyrophosphohydrolase